jgi:hypothetical protein
MTRLIGVSLSPWGQRLHGYVADHVSGLDIVLIRDPRAVVDAGFTAVCVDLGDPWVDRRFVERCDRAGLPIVGVYRTTDLEHDAIDLGITMRMDATMPPPQMVDRLAMIDPPDPADSLLRALDFDAAPLQQRATLVIGGPVGTDPTEIGVALAAAMCVDGSTLLVDFNETDPSLAIRLGYQPTPNVATAASAMAANGALVEHLGRPQTGLASFDFDVICGLPSGDDWNKLNEHDSVHLLAECDQNWSSVVAITGPMLEDLSGWVPRFSVSRRLLATAQHVLAVCDASPVGVMRFGQWLNHANTKVPVLVVITGVPPKSRHAVGEVADRLASMCGERVDVIGWLPADPRVAIAAWNGDLVGRGPFNRAMSDIAIHATHEMEAAWRQQGASR